MSEVLTEKGEQPYRSPDTLSLKQVGREALAAFSDWKMERRMHREALRRCNAHFDSLGIPRLSTYAGPILDQYYPRPDPDTPMPPPTAAEQEDIEAVQRAMEVMRDNDYEYFDPPELGSTQL